MSKRYSHHLWTVIRPLKTWYFLAAFAVCATVGIVALRNNYETMTQLRSAVYTADAQNGDVVGALQALRAFVNGHMNTSLTKDNGSVYPPIQLTHTYQRLQKAEQDRVNAVNSQIYIDAQRTCEQLFPNSFYGASRVPCIEDYVKSHGSTTAKAVTQDLYKFGFASARWSFDLAGWSLAFSLLFLVLAVLRFIAGRVLQVLSK